MTAEECGYSPEPWLGSLIGVVGARGVGCTLLAECLAEELSSDASNRGLVARTGATGAIDLDGLKAGHRFVVADIGSAATSAAISAASAFRASGSLGAPSAQGISSTQSAPRTPTAADAAATLSRCDLIAMIATPRPESLSWLTRTSEALEALLGAERLLTVINRLPRRSSRRMADVAASLRRITGSAALAAGAPLLITESKAVARAARDGSAVQAALTQSLSVGVRLRLDSKP
ncbi:MAG: hypothetical protein OXD37_03060 [Acidimicrobiaceae bacterium]|nr:hypothetical protein [Acidimicrobiaceae bacterium]